MQIKHFVRRNPRLDFKESSKIIERFMSDRARHFGVDVEFCDQFPALTPKNQITVSSNIVNQFSDYDELKIVLKKYEGVQWSDLTIDGLVPGSQFDRVTSGQTVKDGSRTYFSEKQSSYNLQINIFKYKRLKVFLKLLEKYTEIKDLSVSGFADFLDKKEVFNLVAAYGEELRLVEFDRCPVCQSTGTQKLYSHDSQAFLGFMTKRSSTLERCLSCEVIYLNPAPHAEDIPKIYDEFDRQDFVASVNFPYDGKSLRGAFVSELSHPAQCKSLDLGGGIGKFSLHLKGRFPEWNVTHSDFGIKQYPELEQKGINTLALDFSHHGIQKNHYDLITMWEVIEHIHPSRLNFVFENIANGLVSGGRFVFSTPNFDSSLCKAFDFYAACPPFHTFVFSEKWLNWYFGKHESFEIEKIGFCSDMFDDFKGWMGYAKQTGPSLATRAFAEFAESLSDLSSVDREKLAEKVRGSEVIYSLKKK
jgi:SAM-dependent methyltransferase